MVREPVGTSWLLSVLFALESAKCYQTLFKQSWHKFPPMASVLLSSPFDWPLGTLLGPTLHHHGHLSEFNTLYSIAHRWMPTMDMVFMVSLLWQTTGPRCLCNPLSAMHHWLVCILILVAWNIYNNLSNYKCDKCHVTFLWQFSLPFWGNPTCDCGMHWPIRLQPHLDLENVSGFTNLSVSPQLQYCCGLVIC